MLTEPWRTEPDREDGVDATGLPYRILRHSSGHLCGYVRLLDDAPYPNTDTLHVHGGCTGGFDDDDGTWIGFDCGHEGDLKPYWDLEQPGAVYRDLTYVRSECARLAQQLVHG